MQEWAWKFRQGISHKTGRTVLYEGRLRKSFVVDSIEPYFGVKGAHSDGGPSATAVS